MLQGLTPELADAESPKYSRLKKSPKEQLKKFIIKLAVRGSTAAPARKLTKSVESNTRGRYIGTAPTQCASLVEPLPTIQGAIRARRKMPILPISRDFWMRHIKVAKPKITTMFIIDASKSSKAYLAQLSDILRGLFEKYVDPASKIGMIAIQDGAAQMLFSPTRNRLRIFGRIKELSSGGYTPLLKALQMAYLELLRLKKQDTASKMMALLVSDCYPEPLPANVGDPYESELYRSVRQQAALFGQARIAIAIIDPSSPNPRLAEKMPGRKLARHIVKISNGIFINCPAEELRTEGFGMPKFVGDELKNVEAARIAGQLSKLRM